ncbi:MAG: formate dehydrogenase accessory sulfurtransferase FdhD [Thermacetogeniaceae bacterium]
MVQNDSAENQGRVSHPTPPHPEGTRCPVPGTRDPVPGAQAGAAIVPRSIVRIDETGAVEDEDIVVREAALTVNVNDKELATLVCSPVDLKYMAVGFLCAEGILIKRDDLRQITIDEEQGMAWVETRHQENLGEKVFLKRYITPCCGRARASFYFAADALLCKPVTASLQVPLAVILALAEQLQQRSHLFQRTGGVHGAALAQGGEILIFREDIGRHNTLDKIYGQCFLEEIPREDKIIVFSGRVSSEILLKVAKMGVPVLISRSAPTDLALQLADDLGVTVVGFARGNRCNLYAHPERILLEGGAVPVSGTNR